MISAAERDEIDAERGHRLVGVREVRLREWFALREEGEKPDAHRRLVQRLREKRYLASLPPERIVRKRALHTEASRRWRSDRDNYKRERMKQKRKRHAEQAARRAATKVVCQWCGKTWPIANNPNQLKSKKWCSWICKNHGQGRTGPLYDPVKRKADREASAARKTDRERAGLS